MFNKIINNSIFSQINQQQLITSIFHHENNSISDINEIFNKIKAESISNDNSYRSIKLLSFYIRRNRHNLDEIIKKISFFFNSNSGDIKYKMLLKGINTVLNLLTNNNHIINYINMILPILINFLTNYNKSLSFFDEINNTIGRLVKVGSLSIRQIIEKNLESLMNKFLKENENTSFKYENTQFALLQYLYKIMENSRLYIFNKIKEKNTFEIFLRILDYFKDPKPEIRFIIGEIIKQLIHMLNDKDSKTKKEYLKLIYNYLYSQYIIHAQENNNIPNNTNLVSGFLIILEKFYLSEPSFFKDDELYIKLVDNLMKCKNNTRNNSLKVEFIKFIPKLLQMNKEIFIEKYLTQFLEYSNDNLNIKTNSEIRNSLILTLGKLSLVLDKEIFKASFEKLIILIKSLITEKNILEIETLKCLSDSLNNKDGLYIEYFRKEFVLLDILSILFKNIISKYQFEFLKNLMNSFPDTTNENIIISILSLNIVSLIICDEQFDFQYFPLDENKKVASDLNIILPKVSRFIKKNIANLSVNTENEDSEFEDKNRNPPLYIKCKCLNDSNLIIETLDFFSQIKNNLFFKDMLLFYDKKILSFLSFANTKIINKILDITLSDFIQVYIDDISLSRYLINNIINSIKNFLIVNQDICSKLYSIKVLNKKELFYDFILQNKKTYFSEIIGILSNPWEDDSIKENIVKNIGLISNSKSKYNDQKFFMTLINKNISSFLYIIENSNDIIQKENSVSLLLYFFNYLKSFIDFDLIEKSTEILINILLNYDYQGNTNINILKIIGIILSNDEMMKNKIVNNVKFDKYCQILLHICINNLKESRVNETKSNISLEVLYSILKLKNIDIYNNKSSSIVNLNLFENQGTMVNIVDILLKNIIKSENSDNLKNIMNIFGLCGILEPLKMEKYFAFYGLSFNRIEGSLCLEEEYYEENDYIINIFNKKTKTNREIDLSMIDLSTVKAIFSLMRILRENIQIELSSKIISLLGQLIKALSTNESNLIDIILPVIIEIIPKFEFNNQKKLFEIILIIVNEFKHKIIYFLDDIVNLIKNYITKENYYEVIFKILEQLFREYANEMERFYPFFIPVFLSFLKTKKGNNKFIGKLIEFLSLLIKNKNITRYIGLILEDLSSLYLEDIDEQLINSLLEIFHDISSLSNIHLFYPLIITTLIEKFKLISSPKFYYNNQKALNVDIFKLSKEKRLEYLFKISSYQSKNILVLSKSFDVFIAMNEANNIFFVRFLPFIINTFYDTGIINYAETKYKIKEILIEYNNCVFNSLKDYTSRLKSQLCDFNCSNGYYSYIRKIREIEDIKDSQSEKNKKLNKIQKTSEENLSIVKSFENSFCSVEEDWNEWFKSSSKILFEQSPVYILYLCHVLVDYYSPLVIELYNYGFFSIYDNLSEKNKSILLYYLQEALNNTSTPSYILLNIINLSEFFEKKNLNIKFIDHKDFGNISYKFRAFAKALYYKENDFLNKGNFNHFEDLLELYYKMKYPESAIGLLKNIKKYKNIEFKDYIKEHEYILYIKLHQYDKALKIINEQIAIEKKVYEKEILLKNKDICLEGLCNWEELLKTNEEENNTDDIKKIVEKEIKLSNACMNLGKWSELEIHFSKIQKMFQEKGEYFINFKENLDKDEIDDINFYIEHGIIKKKISELLTNNIDNYDIYIKLNNINKTLNNDNFIEYNNIINKDVNFNFLEGNMEILFDLNIYSSILCFNKKNYDIALKYNEAAKNIILNGIKPLLSESYERGYELLVKNQLLFQIEQIINYQKYHSNDINYLKQLKTVLDKNLSIIGKDPIIYGKFLAIRSLILPIEDEYEKYLILSKLYRKSNFFDRSTKILQILKEKLNLDTFNLLTGNFEENQIIIDKEEKPSFPKIKNNKLLREIKIKIELCYNRCIFERGEINETLEKSKNLVDILDKLVESKNQDANNINDKIKSKIYGDYALYKINSYFNNMNSTSLKNTHENLNNKKDLELKTKTLEFSNMEKTKKNILNNDSEGVEEINKYMILSTKLNKNSYKLWSSFALFNYKYYKLISLNKLNDEIIYAMNTVNGLRNSLVIGGKNKNKTFQNLLRLLDMLFSCGEQNTKLLSEIENTLNSIEIEAYLNVLPQLLCRIDIKDKKKLNILINILIKIGTIHPQAVIYYFVVMKLSKKKKLVSENIIKSICKNEPNNRELFEECELFVKEINKCSMVLHEEWFETLENSSKLYMAKDYIRMVKYLLKLHEKSKFKPETMYEINFQQKYRSIINESEYYLKDYINKSNLESLNQAWDIYLNIFSSINNHYSNFKGINLDYISSKLNDFKNSKICIPGSYILDENDSKKLIRIQKMGKILKVFNTKQHPRKIAMIGTDDKEYFFLLKGHEDLRQDERAMQLFNLINTILANDKSISQKNLNIITYSVFPLSKNSGIIGWVSNCDTIHQLIKEHRDITDIPENAEIKRLFKLFPKYESGKMISKVEIFQESLKESSGMEINTMLWLKSKNCETWLNRRTNYSRSLAVMSIVGYILGLGDRHPSNLMLSRKTGQIIHIDFGDCFEVAMKRSRFPEKVPFRLTRIMVKALEISGIEGTFRIICEKVMELLRNNKDSLLAILGSFLYDPLISFRLMIPYMKKKNKNNNLTLSTDSINNSDKVLSKSLEQYNNLNNTSDEEKKNNIIKSIREQVHNTKIDKQNKEKNDKINGEFIEEDENEIIKSIEDHDEFDYEELNKIAKIVLERIEDKLSGTDFNQNIVYDYKTQVDELIKSAISDENLAQSYLGWCPFW